MVEIINSVTDISPKALGELKAWLEPWFPHSATGGALQWEDIGLDCGGGGGGGAGAGIQFHSGTYGADNVGDWLLIEATNFIGENFSVANGGFDPSGDYSIGINAQYGMYLTNDPTLYNIPVITVETVNSTTNVDVYGIYSTVTSDYTGAGGPPEARAVNGEALSQIGLATGVIGLGSSYTGRAIGGSFTGSSGGGAGTGDVIGVFALGTSQAGDATGLLVQAGDPTGFTTPGATSIIQAQAMNAGVAGTVVFEVLRNGHVICRSLPTSDPGVSGSLWVSSGVVHISP